jgi:hypothetical protein
MSAEVGDAEISCSNKLTPIKFVHEMYQFNYLISGVQGLNSESAFLSPNINKFIGL